jgi:hypothetical protein
MNYGLELSLKIEKHLEKLLEEELEKDGREEKREREKEEGVIMMKRGKRASSVLSHAANGSMSVCGGGGGVRYGMQYCSDQASLSSGGDKTDGAEDSLEERALALAIEEMWVENGRRWRPWAANGKACRMGEIVLLLDSDSLVPEVKKKFFLF